MTKLLDKVAVVTGAASGIGKGIAEVYAKEGAKVIVADYDMSGAETVAEEIIAGGGQASAVQVDVSDNDQVVATIQTAIDTYGGLDILVNNAGIMDKNEPVAEIDTEKFDRVIAVNVNGVMYGMRAAINYWLNEDKPGNIINITSIGGLIHGVAGTTYVASKHAVSAMTKSTAFMYTKQNIRVNGIAPGAIATNIASTMTDLSDFGNSRIGGVSALNPGIGHPEDIAHAAVFLASDDAKFINGDIITIDGGFTAPF